MANLTENPIWESGVYQIEKNDPVEGGPEGVSNVQACQLANRTGFLLGELQLTNLRIDDANGRIDEALEGATEQSQSVQAAVETAISDIGVLNKELEQMSTVNIQHGMFMILNRGLISGCEIYVSISEERTITTSAGRCFMHGREWRVPAAAISIPDNDHPWSERHQLYLERTVNGIEIGLGPYAPVDGVAIAEINVPGHSTLISDPYGSAVGITLMGRREPNWPTVQIAPAYIQVTLRRNLTSSFISLLFDVTGYTGGDRPTIFAPYAGRTTNSFRAYLSGSADNVNVRFTTHLMW